MKSVWKWVIGVVIVLVVIASILCAHARVGTYKLGMGNDYKNFRSFEYMPHMDGQFNRFDYPHGMMSQQYGHGYPMVRTSFFMLWGLFPLVLLGLLMYGSYYLGTRKMGSTEKNSGGKQEVVEVEAQNSVVTGPEKNCSKCGEVLQMDWRNCPHCGKRQ